MLTTKRPIRSPFVCTLLLALLGPQLCWVSVAAAAQAPTDKPFKITVVDEQTGRGVPLVELQTVNNVRYVTDSNGIIAFHEPGLMDQKVYFHVKSHGYEFPKDGFGYRGTALEVKEGGAAILRIKRLNIAERLYRLTGAGIYRDSVLVGEKVPLDKPLLNAQVVGCDTVLNVVFRGKIFWVWGDTNRASYPLGNFEVPGATSELPGKGGLDPRLGVNFSYFVDDKGFAKKMTAIPGTGPTWITSLMVVVDAKGQERMFAVVVKVRKQLEIYARGLAEYDERKQLFLPVADFDLAAPLQPDGHTFVRKENGVDYLYFCHPFPLIRVRADTDALTRQASYEAFTCLKQGSGVAKPQFDRDADGKLRWGWKANTAPISPRDQAKWVKQGLLKSNEALLALQDAVTGQPIVMSHGSVYWNAYRRRWIMISVQNLGTSALGEVWYAEADTPLGPWAYAVKIVTHDKYSFYNPKQHPLFDRQGGRFILFEGTYTHTFSGNSEQTPRYDYNQIMYQLDLDDARLRLPVPVYETEKGLEVGRDEKAKPAALAFFALDRERPGTVKVLRDDKSGRLRVGDPASGQEVVLFHALPARASNAPTTSTPLYEFFHGGDQRYTYRTNAKWSSPGFVRTPEPVCLVWRQPLPDHLHWPLDVK